MFYLKMKGDYHRYLAEFKTGVDRKEAAEHTLFAYKAAQVCAQQPAAAWNSNSSSSLHASSRRRPAACWGSGGWVCTQLAAGATGAALPRRNKMRRHWTVVMAPALSCSFSFRLGGLMWTHGHRSPITPMRTVLVLLCASSSQLHPSATHHHPFACLICA